MRKIITVILVSSLFASCFKDTCKSVRTIYYPVFKTLTQARTDMKSLDPIPLENTGKIYIYGHYIFLNEINKGIHVIDNRDPSHPKNLSFVNIPGNEDLAVKGNYLYADSYSDLAVFDISNPENVQALKFVNNVFPDRNYYYYYSLTQNPDSILIPVDWIAKDTLIDCDAYNGIYMDYASAQSSSRGGMVYLASNPGAVNNSNGGAGGSMARFAILNDYLYTVSFSSLRSFNISNAANPELRNVDTIASWMIETIYPFAGKLFIGSQNGMYIYDATNAENPQQLGFATHVRTCDPVIADQNYAYVTLRSGNTCAGFTNQLEIFDLKDLMNPSILQTYQMTNPRGLSKDGDVLFICDENILKVYDAAEINNLQTINQINISETFDVIAFNNIALVVAKDGLYQYDYSDKNNIHLLSKISIQ